MFLEQQVCRWIYEEYKIQIERKKKRVSILDVLLSVVSIAWEPIVLVDNEIVHTHTDHPRSLTGFRCILYISFAQIHNSCFEFETTEKKQDFFPLLRTLKRRRRS